MKILENSLKRFCEIFGRNDFDIGHVAYNDQMSFNYPASLPTSKDLDSLYGHVNFNGHIIVGGEMLLQLESTEKLEGAQHGWRWILNDKQDLQFSSRWNEAWVVIGNRNGDALIVDTSTENSAVYGAIQSDHFKISDSLEKFFDVYVSWMECEYSEFNMETEDEDCNLESEFLERLRKIASDILNPDEVEGFFKFFFG
ncbi:MAG: hypothetical protein P8X74_11775 [Reinekea sp.]